MLRRLGRVEHVWYTIWHVLLLRQWHLRSSYVSIRMSGGPPVVVSRDDDGHFSGTAPKCAPSGPHLGRTARPERVEVSVSEVAGYLGRAHRTRGCRWVAPAASGHTLKSDRLFNSKSSKRTNPRLDTINRRGGERVRFVAIRTVDIYVHAQIRDCRYRERSIHR